MKRLIATIIVLCMLLSVCACSAQNAGQSDGGISAAQSELADQTKTGIVTEINGSSVTLSVSSFSPGENGERPEKPDGENFSFPERPDGENGERPERPDGENFNFPERPDGENGERPEMPEGENPSFAPPGEGMPFGGETITVDLSGASITLGSDAVSIDVIKIGNMIAVTFDSSGKAVSAEIVDIGSGWNGKKPGGSDGE